MKKLTIIVAFCLAMSGVMAWAAGAKDLAGKLPAQSIGEGQAVLADIVKLGPSAVKDLCAKLAMPGEGDVKAEFALSGLALHVVRPGAEAERKMFADALIEALAAEKRDEVKPLLIQLIQACGKEEAVAPLAGQLGKGAVLCDHASRALANIGTPAAGEALLKALSDSKGKYRGSIVSALADLARSGKLASLPKDAEAALIQDAADNDLIVRQSAWRLLGLAGSIDGAGEVLAKAAASVSSQDRAAGTADYLVYVRRLGQADKAKAAAICREMIKAREQAGYKAAAAAALVDILGAEANADLLALADSPSLDVRTSALMLAAGLKGEGLTAAWTAKLDGAQAGKADIVWMLGKRGDASAVPAVAASAKDADAAIRLAAIEALAQLKGQAAVAALVAALGGDQKDDAARAKAVLSRMADPGVDKAVAAAAGQAKGDAKVAMLEVLAARRSTEGGDVVLAAMKDSYAPAKAAAVKALGELADFSVAPHLVALLTETQDAAEQATIQKALVNVCSRQADAQKRAEPILSALPKAQGPAKAALLRTLGKIGGEKALQAVSAEVRTDNADVQDAAVRALCDWPDAGAVNALVDLSRNAPKPAQQVLAIRGLTRIAADLAARDADKATDVFAVALTAAQRPEDKRGVLAALGKVRTLNALKLVIAQLEDAAVAGEAAQAAADIALPNPKKRGDKGMQDPAASVLLARASGAAKDPALKDKLLKHAESIRGK